MTRREMAAAVLLAGAVGQAVLDEGGFKPGSRVIFGLLSAAALAAAVLVDPRAAARAARRPVALVLWALAGLGALSALWTVAIAADALRWGLVAFGYGAVFVSAAVLGRRRRAEVAVSGGICSLAAVSAAFGIAAAAAFAGPFADYTGRTWRPGGTLEYSAALGLLAVSALPGVLTGMCGRSVRVAAAATLSGVLCAIALALGDGRSELAFAGVICLLAMALPERTLRCGRGRAAGAVATLLAAGVAAHLVAGGEVGGYAVPHTARTLTELCAAGLLPGAAWLMFGWPDRGGGRPARAVVASLLAVAVAAAVLGAAPGSSPASASAAPSHRAAAPSHRAAAPSHRAAAPSHRAAAPAPSGGFWHGRLRLWRVAIDTAAERPFAGAGADSFLVASIVRQRSSPVRFAHDLPLELAVELGVPGLLLGLALYGGALWELWRSRATRAAWLLGPATAAFLFANLIDWPWHLAGSGAIWAAALGACATD